MHSAAPALDAIRLVATCHICIGHIKYACEVSCGCNKNRVHSRLVPLHVLEQAATHCTALYCAAGAANTHIIRPCTVRPSFDSISYCECIRAASTCSSAILGAQSILEYEGNKLLGVFCMVRMRIQWMHCSSALNIDWIRLIECSLCASYFCAHDHMLGRFVMTILRRPAEFDRRQAPRKRSYAPWALHHWLLARFKYLQRTSHKFKLKSSPAEFHAGQTRIECTADWCHLCA